jgi:hypothetical protein
MLSLSQQSSTRTLRIVFFLARTNYHFSAEIRALP